MRSVFFFLALLLIVACERLPAPPVAPSKPDAAMPPATQPSSVAPAPLPSAPPTVDPATAAPPAQVLTSEAAVVKPEEAAPSDPPVVPSH